MGKWEKKIKLQQRAISFHLRWVPLHRQIIENCNQLMCHWRRDVADRVKCITDRWHGSDNAHSSSGKLFCHLRQIKHLRKGCRVPNSLYRNLSLEDNEFNSDSFFTTRVWQTVLRPNPPSIYLIATVLYANLLIWLFITPTQIWSRDRYFFFVQTFPAYYLSLLDFITIKHWRYELLDIRVLTMETLPWVNTHNDRKTFSSHTATRADKWFRLYHNCVNNKWSVRINLNINMESNKWFNVQDWSNVVLTLFHFVLTDSRERPFDFVVLSNPCLSFIHPQDNVNFSVTLLEANPPGQFSSLCCFASQFWVEDNTWIEVFSGIT